MTRKTNARLAGFTFLFYIATTITSMVLSGRTTSVADGTAAKLASIAQHASLVQVDVVLTLLQAGCALVLAVTLYALTRDQDRDLALMAMCCRLAEAVIIVSLSTLWILALLSIATRGTAAAGADSAATNALGAWSLQMGDSIGLIAGICFAVGSTLFSWLFLRGRMIPVALAWLGVLASVILVVIFPLQLAGLFGSVTWGSSVSWLTVLPMLVFEVALAVWLLMKGVAMPANQQSPAARA